MGAGSVHNKDTLSNVSGYITCYMQSQVKKEKTPNL
jgi:ribosomal protein S17E